MTDLKLDNSGDLEVQDGRLVLLPTIQEASRQRTQIRLLTYQGEWFLNVNYGIPYFQQILIKTSDTGPIDSILKEAILEDPDIYQIEEFSSTISLNTYHLKFTAVTYSGEIVTYVGQLNT